MRKILADWVKILSFDVPHLRCVNDKLTVSVKTAINRTTYLL